MGPRGCCGCYSLRDGSVAIGITLLVICSLELTLTVGETIYLALHDSGAVTWWLALELAVSAVHLLFNSLLVHGTRRDRRSLILSWLVYHGIVTGLQTAAALVMFVNACTVGVAWFILVMAAALALVAAFWYWFAVVLSHYQHMRPEAGFVYRKHTDEVESHAPGDEAEKQ